MSMFARFMKKNKKVRENTTYAATASLTDESGKPLEWTIRAVTTKEDEQIRDACTAEVPVKGKPNLFRPKLDTTKYMTQLAVAAIVEPNLYDKELQDSYGVFSPEELLKEMIDSPSEYQDLLLFIQRYSGFDNSMDEKVDEAKN